MINGINGFSGYGFSGYGFSNYGYSDASTAANATANGVSGTAPADAKANGVTRGSTPGKVEGAGECQTCKNRKYQDGSNENVSFKTPTRISPNAAAGAVRAHEGEHVSNAYSKAAKGNGKVVNASVSIHTAVCPECGRTYVSGGTTKTLIKYSNEENPYVKNLKAQQADALKGQFIDFAA